MIAAWEPSNNGSFLLRVKDHTHPIYAFFPTTADQLAASTELQSCKAKESTALPLLLKLIKWKWCKLISNTHTVPR